MGAAGVAAAPGVDVVVGAPPKENDGVGVAAAAAALVTGAVPEPNVNAGATCLAPLLFPIEGAFALSGSLAALRSEDEDEAPNVKAGCCCGCADDDGGAADCEAAPNVKAAFVEDGGCVAPVEGAALPNVNGEAEVAGAASASFFLADNFAASASVVDPKFGAAVLAPNVKEGAGAAGVSEEDLAFSEEVCALSSAGLEAPKVKAGVLDIGSAGFADEEGGGDDARSNLNPASGAAVVVGGFELESATASTLAAVTAPKVKAGVLCGAVLVENALA